MKKLILAIVALAVSFSLKAQVLSFDPANQTVDLGQYDYSSDGVALLFNNSSVTRTIKWVRYEDSYQTGWTTTVCDTNNCYSATTSSKQFTLAGNRKASIKLNIFPDSVCGSGSYRILAYDIADSANANAMMYISVDVECVTGISSPVSNALTIYPNPVKDVLHINLNSSMHITSIDIHNIVGQKVKSVNLTDGLKQATISVSDLKQGIYFVRVYSNGIEVATQRFSKD